MMDRLEQVTSFRYLGALISEDGRCIQDVTGRVVIGKEAFSKRKELLTKSLDLGIRKRMVKVLVWPAVLSGCETWTMRKEEMDRLKAFEMWVWGRMSEVIWTDRKMNEEILGLMGEERNMIRTIWERKRNWIGHIARGDGLMKLELEGRLKGKRMRGRPTMGMVDDLVEESYGAMKRRTENRDDWRIWRSRTCPWAVN